MDKGTIIRNFSRCAYTYDRYADIQKRAASELLKLIKKNGIKKIIEIGCGTGNYTLLLREKFPDAELKAIDISKEMLEVAYQKLKNRKIDFITADAESFDLEEHFDLITSNACFQWFLNLEMALKRYKDILRKDGIIIFSIFGPYTFRELNQSFKNLFKNSSFTTNNFMAKEKIKKILQRNFRKIKLQEVIYQETFSCLLDLLNKIKHTGIRGAGFESKAFFTPRLLRQLEEIYLAKFKQIKATYQIFFCQAIR